MLELLSGEVHWLVGRMTTHLQFLIWGCLSAGDLPDTDKVVSVPCEQCLSVSGPGQGDAVWWLCLAAQGDDLGFQVINNRFGFQVPDLDAWSGSSTQPVSVGAEAQGVDHHWHTISGQGVQVFALIEIPKHSHAIFTTWGTQRAIWWNSDSVEESMVTNMVCLDAAVGQIPYLDQFVPSTRNNDWVLGVWWESYTWDPFIVAFIFDCVFALSKCVPQLDALVSRARNNLPVISGESNWQNIFGVSYKGAGGFSSLQIPQPECVIPRSR